MSEPGRIRLGDGPATWEPSPAPGQLEGAIARAHGRKDVHRITRASPRQIRRKLQEALSGIKGSVPRRERARLKKRLSRQ